ncbi:MAG TPA: amidohydrolase family protein [Kofleriaceae bacterium]|nr:amidohydrolase family protein [Kofleriaceae bacterium]
MQFAIVFAASIATVVACTPASPRAPGGGARVLTYAVITSGHPSGAGEIRVEADGTRRTHVAFHDRGRGPDVTTELRVDATGAPRHFRATGHAYEHQPVVERLDERDGRLVWSSAGEHGDAAAGAGFYIPQNHDLDVDLVRALLRAPDRKRALLPAGQAWIESDTIVEIAGRRLHQIAVAGIGFAPELVWLDDELELFARPSSWVSIVRDGAAATLPALLAADQTWLTARAERLAQQLAHRPPAAGLAITHARVFDAERRTVLPDATVVVVGDRIVAVGERAAVPAGAQVIDARGRTLLPGFWDMHVHLRDTDGVAELAAGVTTVRDLGNDADELGARIARIAAGRELGPTVLRAGFIDGAGKLAAPIGVQVATADEARAAVQRYADQGFVQIKIYSSVPPALVPVIAGAAHERGLRVSGHVPTGMNAAQAVDAGFDELQHVNFLFLQFLAGPDDDTRTQLRVTRVAERGASLDLASPEVRSFLDLLVAHRTVIDPTVAIYEGIFTSEPGDLTPYLVPFRGRLPSQIERGGGGPGGLDAPGSKRATYRASYAAMLRMIKLAHDRGVAIVAGTDAAGLSYPRELELYAQAGIPAPDVLALASLGAARVMGKDRDAGSITAGKRADLVLVDGDPTRDISAIRRTDLVIARGVAYDPDELYASLGVAPRRREH